VSDLGDVFERERPEPQSSPVVSVFRFSLACASSKGLAYAAAHEPQKKDPYA